MDGTGNVEKARTQTDTPLEDAAERIAMDEEFAARGYVRCPAVLPADVVARASAAIDHLYSSPEANVGHPGGRTDGVTQYCADPGLFELFSQPALERIAQFILQTKSCFRAQRSCTRGPNRA